MKPSRIIILSVAVFAAGIAGVLVMQLTNANVEDPSSTRASEPVPTVKVLVSSINLPIGSRLNESSIEWADWPNGLATSNLVNQATRPNAIEELNGTVVRLPIFAGEPLRAEKIVDSDSKIMSSLLPAGKRAVSVDISVSTGAGGFVLPNDRVDVIMVRSSDEGKMLTEKVLNNVRVLAIDQQFQKTDEGEGAVLGATATLELSLDQARILAISQQMSDRLTLALRSIADAQEDDLLSADYLLNDGSGKYDVQVIKSGSIVRETEGAAK